MLKEISYIPAGLETWRVDLSYGSLIFCIQFEFKSNEIQYFYNYAIIQIMKWK